MMHKLYLDGEIFMKTYELVVPCHFGMEAVTKREIYDLGYEITRVEDGRITFEGDATRTFKIRLIDIEYDNPTPPQISHPTSFKVRFSILKDCINDIDIFSDKIALQVDEDYFIASADGEFGDASIKYLHGENIQSHEKALFSLDKIREMLKADKFSER